MIAIAVLLGCFLTASAPARAQGLIFLWSAHANLAVNCEPAPAGCISSGPNCDMQAVPGQCSFPRARATELCGLHPECFAVTCNSARDDCQARRTSRLDPWQGFTSYVQWTQFAYLAVNCEPAPVGCISSGPNCDTQAVPGQCSFPKARAQELCALNTECMSVTCNSARDDCQARRTTRLDPWLGFTSWIRGRPTTPR
jgi:hypothetical protein